MGKKVKKKTKKRIIKKIKTKTYDKKKGYGTSIDFAESRRF